MKWMVTGEGRKWNKASRERRDRSALVRHVPDGLPKAVLPGPSTPDRDDLDSLVQSIYAPKHHSCADTAALTQKGVIPALRTF